MIFKNIFLEYFLNLLSKCLTAFASVYYFSKDSRILAIVYQLISFLDNKILLSYYERFQHIFEIYKVWQSLFRTVIMIADCNSFQLVAGLLEHVSFSSESQPFTHKKY